MNRETMKKYIKDIEIEQDARKRNPDTPQNQRRLQSIAVQLKSLRSQLREMEG